MDDGARMMVAAVRDDSIVGRGTCSSIDECYSDVEVAETLRLRGARDAAGAVEAPAATRRAPGCRARIPWDRWREPAGG